MLILASHGIQEGGDMRILYERGWAGHRSLPGLDLARRVIPLLRMDIQDFACSTIQA